MIIKFRDERRGNHVHSRVFIGPDEDHLALAGTLVFNIGEWQMFGACLLSGAKRHSIVEVQMPDDMKVVEHDARD